MSRSTVESHPRLHLPDHRPRHSGMNARAYRIMFWRRGVMLPATVSALAAAPTPAPADVLESITLDSDDMRPGHASTLKLTPLSAYYSPATLSDMPTAEFYLDEHFSSSSTSF